MNYYAVLHWVVTDGGGEWYEVGEVVATDRMNAIRSRWSDGLIPNGWRIVAK